MRAPFIAAAVVLAALSITAAGVPRPAESSVAPAASAGVIYLTFDDGPSSGYTDEVVTDLQAAGARATFFMIGYNSGYPTSGMKGHAALTRKVLSAGNQIGTHSWSHPYFPSLSKSQTRNEISRARSLQISQTGHDSKLFRYPYLTSSAYGDAYLASQHMRAVGADIEPNDWDTSVSDAEVIASVMKAAHDGAIVCLHDGTDVLGRGHPSYLPGLLTQLKAAGYTFGTL